MSNPFALQVTPELMQRLVDQGEKKRTRKRQAKKQLKPPTSPLGQENTLQWHEADARQASYLPPFAGIFGGPHSVEPPAADLTKELAPVYQAIEQSEQLAQRLQQRGDSELAKVQDMARDLQDKQYRAPSHAPLCANERGNCVDCYKQNAKNPLLCSKLVQEFVACSRQAHVTARVLLVDKVLYGRKAYPTPHQLIPFENCMQEFAASVS